MFARLELRAWGLVIPGAILLPGEMLSGGGSAGALGGAVTGRDRAATGVARPGRADVMEISESPGEACSSSRTRSLCVRGLRWRAAPGQSGRDAAAGRPARERGAGVPMNGIAHAYRGGRVLGRRVTWAGPRGQPGGDPPARAAVPYSVRRNCAMAIPSMDRPITATIPSDSHSGTSQPTQVTPGASACSAAGLTERWLNTARRIGSTM
jgi:hypothetical protein